ncbi:hypothetical protein [Herbidospora cretacea]|uniref:hypothetical protein n=1 Tax=Herbidospora cretacea TaxID=28444 RepID=UPI0004C3555F|nr:hypothetical protein [Herbidospora cretacea]
MIRRLFYMTLGASLAVWVMRKLESLRPDHVARRTAHQVRDFADDVRAMAANRENELRARHGLGTVGHITNDVKDGR